MQKKYRIIFVMANGKEIKIYRSSETQRTRAGRIRREEGVLRNTENQKG